MLAGIFKIASEGIIILDERHRILMFSPGAEAIFGYSAAAIVGSGLERLIPTRFRGSHHAHVARFAGGDRDSLVMRERKPIYGLRRNGEEFPLEASLSRQRTPDGWTFTTIVRDVTERHLAQETLRRSEQRLRIALEAAETQVFELDLQARTITSAGVAGTFPEMPKRLDDAGVDDVWACMHPDDRPAARAAWRRHARAGAPFRIEARLILRDGREAWASLSAEMIRSAKGEPLRVVGALRDVTERRQSELAAIEAAAAAEAANTAKSAFLATMSHEIRTPLNGVLGMAQALAADTLTAVQQERVEVIRQSGAALLAILNDVLDLSKIEAGKLELEETEFELGELLRGAEATFAAVAAGKGVGFTLEIAHAEGVYRGDPTRLRQVLYNLISNALKFTETGGVRVDCAYDAPDLRLAVTDTGIGIAPEALANLFAAFVQADATTTRRFGGTGLGLAISKELVELMGGSLGATSTPGVGSTFTVLLPLARCEAAPGAGMRPADDGRPGWEARDHRILVAEDNPTNQLVIRTLLEQLGLAVTVVGNGQAAVAAWEAGGFDAVLMDVQMPVLDGPGATRLIRRGEAIARRARTPIIGLTANAMAHQIAEYAAAGMDQILTKPIDVGKLAATLDAVLASTGRLEDGNRAAAAAT